MKNKYNAIVCTDVKGVIGKDGKLLYHIKSDMSNFKSLTTDNVVIMGRKTFESLPDKKPLKNRINIIVTRNEDYFAYGIEWSEEERNNTYVVNSLEELDDLCYAYFADKELYIIGGGELYQSAYEADMIDKAIITLVNEEGEGDTFFPKLDCDDAYKQIFKTTILRDYSNNVYYRYIVFKKK